MTAGNAGTDPLAEDRMFVAEELRDALVETTLSYGDRNRAAWALVDWLTAHDAQVRAEALEDAADELGPLVSAQHPATVNPDQWLRDRAVRIYEGVTE